MSQQSAVSESAISKIPVTGMKSSASAIAAKAKAQLAAQKAQLAAQQKELKQAETALNAEAKQSKAEAKYIKAEALAASGNSPYMVENQYKGTSDDWMENMKQQNELNAVLFLADVAKAGMKAHKAQQALEKAKKQVEATSAPKTPEYENGNEVIQTQLPLAHADVLNMIADGLSASIPSKGKNKGQVIIKAAQIDSAKLKTIHSQALESLVKNDYVEFVHGGGLMLTAKGLSVFGITLEQVKENFLAKQ